MSSALAFSPWGLFLQAGWFVKLILLGLVGTSVWCWSIIFEKLVYLQKVQRAARRFEEQFWSGVSLDRLLVSVGQNPADPMTSIFIAAMKEWTRLRKVPTADITYVINRVEHTMQVTLSREMEPLERALPILASVGSSAPFVGLLGTVWGIVTSFNSIAASHQASLAVVAPGIAESLFATALGLIAAIPASVAYNKISSDLGLYVGKIDRLASQLTSLLSRYMEEGHL